MKLIFLVLVLKLERFNYFKDEQLENIPFILVILLILKLERYNSFKDEHPSNM